MKKKIPAGNIKLKRTYDAAAPDDGTRILVDRLWPRGVRKSDAAIDQWLKDLAPSTELRQWFKHDPALWPEFRSRYAEELHQHPALLDSCASWRGSGPSPCSIRRTMQSITMRLRYAHCCWTAIPKPDWQLCGGYNARHERIFQNKTAAGLDRVFRDPAQCACALHLSRDFGHRPGKPQPGPRFVPSTARASSRSAPTMRSPPMARRVRRRSHPRIVRFAPRTQERSPFLRPP